MPSSAIHYETSWTPETLPPTHRNTLLLNWIGREKRVLEMGCATGFFSRFIAANGCRVVGVEYDPQAAAIARSHCEQVIVGDLNVSDWKQQIVGRFDAVVFGDVLEHLLDPLQALRECRDLLADNGTIIVSIPNVAHWSNRLSLLRGHWDYTDIGLLDRTHVRFFTVSTARQLFIDAGYQILRFHPVIGGTGAGKMPALWTILTNLMPNLMGYQLLFEIR